MNRLQKQAGADVVGVLAGVYNMKQAGGGYSTAERLSETTAAAAAATASCLLTDSSYRACITEE
jgi:hypothetical protein